MLPWQLGQARSAEPGPRGHAEGRVFLGGPEDGRVRLNSIGLRGREVAPRKPVGVKRVLVLGDSFVFGVGVNEPSVFSSRLEALLNAEEPDRYEVVNMGVSGYSTDQQYLLYQEVGASLQPDIVVLVACDNDFDGNLQDFAYLAYYKPYFELTLRSAPRSINNRAISIWPRSQAKKSGVES